MQVHSLMKSQFSSALYKALSKLEIPGTNCLCLETLGIYNCQKVKISGQVSEVLLAWTSNWILVLQMFLLNERKLTQGNTELKAGGSRRAWSKAIIKRPFFKRTNNACCQRASWSHSVFWFWSSCKDSLSYMDTQNAFFQATLRYTKVAADTGRKPCMWRSYRIRFPFCVRPFMYFCWNSKWFSYTLALLCFLSSKLSFWTTYSQPCSCSILHNFPIKSSDSSPENTSILELGSRRAASMESSSVLKHWKSVPFRIQTTFQIYLLILFIRVICS